MVKSILLGAKRKNSLTTEQMHHIRDFVGDPNIPARVLKSSFDAQGDLLAASADNTPVRLPVGSDGEILIANSDISTGLEWISLVAYESELVIHEDGAVYI